MRWALGLEYEGSNYHGWQSQEEPPALDTVQQRVEAALSTIANQKIGVVCAGRTDKGVHAIEQVIHFDTDASRRDSIWVSGANRFLPPDIRALWACPVSENFHARYTALARSYTYLIANQTVCPALLRSQITWFPQKLDENKMLEAAQFLIGEHDFNAFRGTDCQAKTSWRKVNHLVVERKGNIVRITIQANAFLHHMVRNIVGVLGEVGTHKRPPQWAKEVLLGRDRRLGGVTAPPNGLYLAHVLYPEEFKIPNGAMRVWYDKLF
jgi:tRNA pseudouridine38-40 synthase